MKTAYAQQKLIGTKIIWRGLISQKFGDMQETTYRSFGYGHEFSGTAWARKIVGQFLKYFELIWEERNQRIHEEKGPNLQIY